jgi:hypothetical protein
MPSSPRWSTVSSSFVALIDIHHPARYEDCLAGYDAVFESYDRQVIAVEDEPRDESS